VGWPPRLGELRSARDRAHPDRLGPPAVPARSPPPRRGLARAGQDHHRVHARPQRDARPRRARHRRATRSSRGGGHRAVDRVRRRRESVLQAGRRPALARQLLLRPGPRLRLLRRAARARAVLAWAPALALRIQRRGRDRPGARRRGRRPGARARAGDALGAAHDLELLAGDPARRRRPVRRAGVLLTRLGLPGGLRDGLVASLALVPWVYLGSAAAISGAFVGGVAVGTALGGLVERPERYGLDFAFPAVFLALVAVQLRRRADWLVAIGAAVLAVALALVLPGNWHIVVAGLTVSALGARVLPVEDAPAPAEPYASLQGGHE